MKVTYSEHARVCNEREQLAGKLRLAESNRDHWKAEAARLQNEVAELAASLACREVDESAQ